MEIGRIDGCVRLLEMGRKGGYVRLMDKRSGPWVRQVVIDMITDRIVMYMSRIDG